MTKYVPPEPWFEMFKRCSIRQWLGYKPKVRQMMTDSLEGGWVAYESGKDYSPPCAVYTIWQVIPPAAGKLSVNQSTLMKVIEE